MILLDTHVWIWWLSNPEALPPKVTKALEQSMAARSILLSAISAWEIAMLVKKKRLVLSLSVQDWIHKTESLPFINFLPVDNRIAIQSVFLPEPLHSDPADRIIITTAITHNATLITKDQKMLDYSPVNTLWE